MPDVIGFWAADVHYSLLTPLYSLRIRKIAAGFFLILKYRWFKKFVGRGVPELGELLIMLSHEVHDVAQRLDVKRVPLQRADDYRAQPPYNFAMLRV